MSNNDQIEELRRVVKNLQEATSEFANTLLDFSKTMDSGEIKALIAEFGKQEYKAQNKGVFKNGAIVRKSEGEFILPKKQNESKN
jgi:hypothetical protein